jgi:hypothetical protein
MILAIFFKKYFLIVPIVLAALFYQYIATRAYLGEPFVGSRLSVKKRVLARRAMK